jgi:TRAP-type transport system small permease protein
MTNPIKNAEKWGIWLSRVLSLLGILGFVILALGTVSDVMLRWLFSAPIDGFAEVSRLAVAIMTATFLPAALIERYHINIEFLGASLGPAMHKTLNVFAAIVTFGFFTVVGWEFIGYTQELAEAGEATWIIGIKVAPYWWVVTAFVMLCIPAQFIVILRAIITPPDAKKMS